MRCPRCNSKMVMEKYARNYENGMWFREIYCTECHFNDLQDVDLEKISLEDLAEIQLQRIHDSVKRKIVSCFETGETYTDGLLLGDKDGALVEVDVKVYRSKLE